MKKRQKLMQISTCLLMFLLPLQTRYFFKTGIINGGFWEYGSFSLYVTEVLIFLLIMWKIILYVKLNGFRYKKRQIFQGKTLKIISLILIVYIIFSIFFSVNREISFFYSIKFIEVFLLIWLIISAKIDSKWLLLSLVLGISFHGFFAIYQFFIQSVPSSMLLGIAAQNPATLGVAVVGTKFGRFLRSYGGLPHPNILAGWLVLGLWAILVLYQQSLSKKKAFIVKSLLLFLLVVLFSGLILSFSRSAMMGFLVSWILLLLYLVYTSAAQNKKVVFNVTFNAIAIFIFAFALLLVLWGTMLREPLTERGMGIVSRNRLEVQSIVERKRGFNESVALIKKHFWFGSGIGTYTYDLSLMRPEFQVWQLQPVHNILLLISSELGIVGLGLILFIIISLIRFYYQQMNIFSFVLLVSFIPIVLADHYLWTLYPGLILSGAVIAFSLRKVQSF